MEIIERLTLSLKAVAYQLNTECDTRMVLDAILQALCVQKGLVIRTEQTLKCDSLPENMYCNIWASKQGFIPYTIQDTNKMAGK